MTRREWDRWVHCSIEIVGAFVIATILIALLYIAAFGREGDDHGNHGALKTWFDHLASGKGLCCSFADGMAIEDVDWDTDGPKDKDGNATFRVRLADKWVVDRPAGNLPGSEDHLKPAPDAIFSWWPIPPDALISEPNRFGQAVVWPIIYAGRITAIRCFMPGAGT